MKIIKEIGGKYINIDHIVELYITIGFNLLDEEVYEVTAMLDNGNIHQIRIFETESEAKNWLDDFVNRING